MTPLGDGVAASVPVLRRKRGAGCVKVWARVEGVV